MKEKPAVTEKPAGAQERSPGEKPAGAATPVAAEHTGEGAYGIRIRPGADKTHRVRSRHIPNGVKRANPNLREVKTLRFGPPRYPIDAMPASYEQTQIRV